MSSPPIDILVLDAAPLLSLAPLKGLAKTYVTIPQVLAELRDPRAREHFQKLGTEGLDVLVKSPDVVSYSKGAKLKAWCGERPGFLILRMTVSDCRCEEKWGLCGALPDRHDAPSARRELS